MIHLIRLIVTLSYFSVVFTLGILLCFIRPFNPNNLYVMGLMISWKSFQILGIDFDQRGMEKMPKNSPAVFMSNHQDNMDFFFGAACLQPKTVLIAKKAIKWIPFFGQAFWLSGNILLDRKNSTRAKASMKKVTQRVKEDGVSMWILPEGTRSRGRGLLPFKKGGFITAIECQIPIVPVVWNEYRGTLNFNKIKSGKIISQVLDPIETKGLTLDDLDSLMEKTHQMFANELAKMKAELSH